MHVFETLHPNGLPDLKVLLVAILLLYTYLLVVLSVYCELELRARIVDDFS